MPVSDVREKTFREALFSGEMDMEGMDSVLALYRGLYPERNWFQTEGTEFRIPGQSEIAARLGDGFTILDPADILPGPQELAAKGKDVSLILTRHSEDPDSIVKTMERAQGNADSFLDLARTSLLCNGRPPVAEEEPFVGMNMEILAFIIFNATKSLFIRAARQLGEINTEQWDHGRCPVCGGSPAVACLLGEGGKRFLVCHRCESIWRFRRLACPNCEKEKPEGSPYVYLEHPRYKMMTGQVCDECKSYIKTWRVESEDLEDFHPEVEDLMTPAFDLALAGEEYHRGGGNVFGIRIGPGREKAQGH